MWVCGKAGFSLHAGTFPFHRTDAEKMWKCGNTNSNGKSGNFVEWKTYKCGKNRGKSKCVLGKSGNTKWSDLWKKQTQLVRVQGDSLEESPFSFPQRFPQCVENNVESRLKVVKNVQNRHYALLLSQIFLMVSSTSCFSVWSRVMPASMLLMA